MSEDGESIGSWILKGLAAAGEYQRLDESFAQEWYTVAEAHRELQAKGATISLETLRRWIRSGKVKVSKPSPRKTLVHKRELVRLLSSRA